LRWAVFWSAWRSRHAWTDANDVPYSLSSEAARRAREAFQSALDAAVPAYQLGQLHLFQDDEESFIQKEVERKLYEQKLPSGGAKERRTVERLEKLAMEQEFDGCRRASYAVKMWKKVLADDPRNPGRYYIRHPITPRSNKTDFEYYNHLKDAARSNRQWEKKWFAEVMLEGLPEPISNFRMECMFLLRDSMGTVERLVRLKNVLGEVSKGPNPGGSELLDAEAFHAPQKFRKWAVSKGNFNWAGNEKHIELLHEDIAHEAAYRVVDRIDSVGWHELPKSVTPLPDGLCNGLWFYDECAYTTDGRLLMPDEDGIIWHEGHGYYLSQKGREAQFLQRRPKMHPGWKAAEFKLSGMENAPRDDSEKEILRALFREACQKLCETVGGYEGYFLIGAMLAYSAAPEIFRKHGMFPGLWVHGLKGSGKTKVTSWLMSLRGFSIEAGVGIVKTATPAGMLQDAENYSNEPFWLDEFRDAEVEPIKLAILRNAFNRQVQSKWTADGIQRVMKTCYIVSGESTSSDAALRSRYPHVQVSANKRKKEHLPWFEAHKEYLFALARYTMENRPAFVSGMMDCLENWLGHGKLSGVDDREKKVHGIGYSAWHSINQLLGAHDSSASVEFTSFMLNYSRAAAADVTSETNINIFWTDLLTALKADDAISLTCFRLESTYAEAPPSLPNQKFGWKSYRLFMNPEPVLKSLAIYLSKARGQITLKRQDLRDQLSKERYWIPGQIKKRFGPAGDMTTEACWGVNIDLHPMGLQPATDEQVNDYLLKKEEGDPRKGPLFGLIHRLEGVEQAKA
jgi:hypothetical protein